MFPYKNVLKRLRNTQQKTKQYLSTSVNVTCLTFKFNHIFSRYFLALRLDSEHHIIMSDKIVFFYYDYDFYINLFDHFRFLIQIKSKSALNVKSRDKQVSYQVKAIYLSVLLVMNYSAATAPSDHGVIPPIITRKIHCRCTCFVFSALHHEWFSLSYIVTWYITQWWRHPIRSQSGCGA